MRRTFCRRPDSHLTALGLLALVLRILAQEELSHLRRAFPEHAVLGHLDRSVELVERRVRGQIMAAIRPALLHVDLANPVRVAFVESLSCEDLLAASPPSPGRRPTSSQTSPTREKQKARPAVPPCKQGLNCHGPDPTSRLYYIGPVVRSHETSRIYPNSTSHNITKVFAQTLCVSGHLHNLCMPVSAPR